MNNNIDKKHIENTNGSLKDSVLSRIEKDCVEPKTKWLCFCSDNAVWALWILTVIIGAIAFSQSIYIGMHSGIEFYDMTHGSMFAFVVESLPYVWLATFALMAFFANYNMRKTKRGYKYPIWQIILSSVVFTVVGGFALYTAGVSNVVERMIGKSAPLYTTVEERQDYLWAHPQDGRISGVFVSRVDGTMDIKFKDAVNRDWIVATHELPPKDIALLLSGERVRLLGEADINAVRNFFYGCGVLPWDKEDGVTLKSIRENRENVEQHVLQFSNFVAIRTDSSEETQPSLRCREIMETFSPKG